jgi:hypothetical protein
MIILSEQSFDSCYGVAVINWFFKRAGNYGNRLGKV